MQGHYELRVDLEDFEGNETYARYSNFRLGNACTKYTLILGTYSGNAGKLFDGTAFINLVRPFW